MASAYARKEGKIRLVHVDAHDIVLGVLGEWNTMVFPGVVNSTTGAITEHNDAQKLPKLIKKPKKVPGGQIMERDEKLLLRFAASAAPSTALEGTKSYVRIPVTLENIRSGYVFESMLDAAAAGFTSDAKVAIQNEFITLGILTIGAQEAIKLGHVPFDTRVDGAFSFIIVELTTT